MANKSYIGNATATKVGGALTILKEYLSELNNSEIDAKYFVFCGVDIDEFVSDNIKIIQIKTHGFGIGGIKRFLWDLVMDDSKKRETGTKLRIPTTTVK